MRSPSPPHVPRICAGSHLGDSQSVCPSSGAAHHQPVCADMLPALSPGAQGLGRAISQWAGFPGREAATRLCANARAEPPGRDATVDLPELPEERGGGRATGGAGAGPGGMQLRSRGFKAGAVAVGMWHWLPCGTDWMCGSHPHSELSVPDIPVFTSLPRAASGSAGQALLEQCMILWRPIQQPAMT